MNGGLVEPIDWLKVPPGIPGQRKGAASALGPWHGTCRSPPACRVGQLLTGTAKKVGEPRRSASDDQDRQKTLPIDRHSLLLRFASQRWSTLLGAGLDLSVGCSGGEVRVAVATSDQVAPEGCTMRLRSLGDRT